MFNNNSPWLHQLKSTRTRRSLTTDVSADVAIVGGGIAGVATAFFALRGTRRTIAIIEANKIAHGATGHNAGQIVSYFEHPFADLVKQFGLTRAAQGQQAIFSAWELLEEMYEFAHLTTPLSVFTGYAGCSSLEQILFHLQNKQYQRAAGLNIESVLVLDDPAVAGRIPAEFEGLYAAVPREHILNVLETTDTRYVGALASRKGCLNSALFCEELIDFLLVHYAGRFQVIEHTPVSEIILEKGRTHLKTTGAHTVTADRVVLCTNGFQNVHITNMIGGDIDKKFHESVIGRISYMAGFLEKPESFPAAVSYFNSPAVQDMEHFDTAESDPYYYFTRRRFEHNEHGLKNLVCIGGPEEPLPNKNVYSRDRNFPAEAKAAIDDFMRTTYRHVPPGKIPYAFEWHGLMGYTPNGIRCIGPEPCNPVLLYNLGCNGVGILPSIYGGKRISLFLKKQKLEKSIFDPLDQRCPI